MRKLLKLYFLLTLTAVAASAQTTDSVQVAVLPSRLEKKTVVDISFETLDSIRKHPNALYASKVMRDNGFKMVYGRDVKQRGWKKYYLHEAAFSNTASYDERRDAWKTPKNQPFSYIRIIYDGYSKRLYHYQVKFSTRTAYQLFHKDAIANGFIYKSKKLDKVDMGVECTYYNASTNCYMVFGEYEGEQFLVDLWYDGDGLTR